MAQKSTSVWRCRALSDSSAQTPLASGSSVMLACRYQRQGQVQPGRGSTARAGRPPAVDFGLAVMPTSTANATQALQTRILRITGPQIRSRLELAWNSVPSANPATRVLIEHAKALGKVPLRSG